MLILNTHNERLANNDDYNSKQRPHPKHGHRVYKYNIAHRVAFGIVDTHL